MKKMDRILKEWIYAFVSAVIIVIVISYAAWPMHVKGSSMENTLSSGEIIVVSKLSLYFKPCRVDDVIVIELEDGNKKEKIVKRVIAIEGEHVVIKDGVVSINGKRVEEPYVTSPTASEVDLFVPKNSYFVLGDNRPISKDSRAFGCVLEEDIRGRVIFPKGL